MLEHVTFRICGVVFARFIGCCLALAVYNVSLSAAESGPKPVTSLRVESAKKIEGVDPGSFEVVYRMVNVADKAIVAWEMTCVLSTQAGKAQHGSVGQDSYQAFEEERLLGIPPLHPGAIKPGDVHEQKVSFSAEELDGPMAGKTCAPAMVLFEDTTFEGEETSARFFFGLRVKTAVEAQIGLRALKEELGRGTPFEQTVDLLAARLARPATDPKGTDHAGNLFGNYRQRLAKGAPVTAEEALQKLAFDYQAAMNHLPGAWQQQVLAEVNP